MIGQTLSGRYQVLQSLDAGGMGVVYRARDVSLERDVAVKVIRAEAAGDETARVRFRREALALSKLNHPHINAIYDFGVHEGKGFLIMELVSGETLARKLATGPLSGREAVRIGAQIADALEAAHAHGIVHCDLKPANVMVTDRGEAKVLDFGLARLLRSETDTTTLPSGLTQSQAGLGTPAYMAPEQLLGEEVDARADLYGLGATLFEMTTGRPPFLHEPGRTYAHKILHGRPLTPSSLNPAVSPMLDRLVLRCLEKDPKDRPPSAAQVLAELRQLTHSESSIAMTRSAAYPEASLRARANALRVLTVGAAVLLAAGIGAGFWLRSRSAAFVADRVVVVPFENRTGDSALDPLGPMVADWITGGLARTGIVDVVPFPNATSPFYSARAGGSDGSARGTGSSPPSSGGVRYAAPSAVEASSQSGSGSIQVAGRFRDLAVETGAATVISGVYYRQGDSLRFHAQVTDARNGRILRAIDPVIGPAVRPEVLVETLRQRVTAVLAVLFNPRLESYAAVTSEPPSIDAYEEYIAGEELFILRDFEGAIDHYLQAAARDSNYTLPLLQAAVSYWYLGRNAQADTLLHRVRRQNEQLAPLDRLRLVSLTARVHGDLMGDYQSLSRLVQLAPRSGWSYAQASGALRLGRAREAVQILVRIDPQRGWYKGWSAYWTVLTAARHMLGEHEAELQDARRGRRQYPEGLSILASEVRALAALGRVAELDEALRMSSALPPEPGMTAGDVLRIAAAELDAHGYAEHARPVLGRALAWYGSRPPEEGRTELARRGFAQSLYQASRYGDARELNLGLVEEFPENLEYQASLSLCDVGANNRVSAQAVLEKMRRISGPYVNGAQIYAAARIAAALGQREESVILLRQAFAQGHAYDLELHAAPEFRSLRGYRPFEERLRSKG